MKRMSIDGCLKRRKVIQTTEVVWSTSEVFILVLVLLDCLNHPWHKPTVHRSHLPTHSPLCPEPEPVVCECVVMMTDRMLTGQLPNTRLKHTSHTTTDEVVFKRTHDAIASMRHSYLQASVLFTMNSFIEPSSNDCLHYN